MRIIIADSQAATLRALVLLLGSEPDIQVIGEAGDQKDLLAQVKNKQSDIVLLDWQLVRSKPEDIISELKFVESHPQIIVLHTRPETYVDAKAAGADHFFCKDSPPDQLLACLRKLKQEKTTHFMKISNSADESDSNGDKS